MGEDTPVVRKLRADQARNRDRLLTAAREVFRSDGASLEAVARRADLGIATLYRHFPTREALFQAVYAREVETLETLARADDLSVWMHAALDMMATKRGMVAALPPVLDKDAPFFTEQSARMLAAVRGLRNRAVTTGKVRGTITADDLIRIPLSLSYGPGADQARAGLLLDVFLDGLRQR